MNQTPVHTCPCAHRKVADHCMHVAIPRIQRCSEAVPSTLRTGLVPTSQRRLRPCFPTLGTAGSMLMSQISRRPHKVADCSLVFHSRSIRPGKTRFPTPQKVGLQMSLVVSKGLSLYTPDCFKAKRSTWQSMPIFRGVSLVGRPRAFQHFFRCRMQTFSSHLLQIPSSSISARCLARAANPVDLGFQAIITAVFIPKTLLICNNPIAYS